MSEKEKKCVKGFFVVGNDKGLHTRPSTELVKCATSFRSKMKLYYHSNEANAKSLLGILMLAACKGAKVQVEVVGVDAEEALQSLIDLASQNFNISY